MSVASLWIWSRIKRQNLTPCHVSNDVVEVTNPARELFSFERMRKISGLHAAVIAERVQSFGQEDDITVPGVEYSAA